MWKLASKFSELYKTYLTPFKLQLSLLRPCPGETLGGLLWNGDRRGVCCVCTSVCVCGGRVRVWWVNFEKLTTVFWQTAFFLLLASRLSSAFLLWDTLEPS